MTDFTSVWTPRIKGKMGFGFNKIGQDKDHHVWTFGRCFLPGWGFNVCE